MRGASGGTGTAEGRADACAPRRPQWGRRRREYHQRRRRSWHGVVQWVV